MQRRSEAAEDPAAFLWWDDMLRYVETFAKTLGQDLGSGIPPRPHEDPTLPDSVRRHAVDNGLWTGVLWKRKDSRSHLALVPTS